MRIDIVTVFPDLVAVPVQESILKRAQDKGVVNVFIHDLRTFTPDKHHQVDDYPYGGGAGMILKPEPFFHCVESILAAQPQEQKRKIIFLSPQGQMFSQKMANELTTFDHLLFLCGHYKGVDERVIQGLVDEEISIGDYVLTGGELPALVIIDAVVRLLPGVLNDAESAATDSFQQAWLDCAYYTRPEEFRGIRVPEVLLSGHHEKIREWRRQQSMERTQKRRKDLFDKNNENLNLDRMEEM